MTSAITFDQSISIALKTGGKAFVAAHIDGDIALHGDEAMGFTVTHIASGCSFCSRLPLVDAVELMGRFNGELREDLAALKIVGSKIHYCTPRLADAIQAAQAKRLL